MFIIFTRTLFILSSNTSSSPVSTLRYCSLLYLYLHPCSASYPIPPVHQFQPSDMFFICTLSLFILSPNTSCSPVLTHRHCLLLYLRPHLFHPLIQYLLFTSFNPTELLTIFTSTLFILSSNTSSHQFLPSDSVHPHPVHPVNLYLLFNSFIPLKPSPNETVHYLRTLFILSSNTSSSSVSTLQYCSLSSPHPFHPLTHTSCLPV
jgi:hypothetical protein